MQAYPTIWKRLLGLVSRRRPADEPPAPPTDAEGSQPSSEDILARAAEHRQDAGKPRT